MAASTSNNGGATAQITNCVDMNRIAPSGGITTNNINNPSNICINNLHVCVKYQDGGRM